MSSTRNKSILVNLQRGVIIKTQVYETTFYGDNRCPWLPLSVNVESLFSRMTVAVRNKRAGYNFILNSKVRKIKEINNKESPNLKCLYRTQDRLRYVWKNYEGSHQAILTFVAKDQVFLYI